MSTTQRRRARTDDGFTLLELVVSMAVFSLLMILVSAIALSGMKSIRSMTTLSNTQVQEQDTAEWLSRLLRYTDNPVDTYPVTPAVTYAGLTAGKPVLTFHTFAGIGARDRIPYKVTITQNAKGIVTQAMTPDMSSGSPVYSTPAHERILVPVVNGNTPTLQLRYWGGTPAAPIELVPPANGTLTDAQMNSIRSVQFTISGSGSNMIVDRTVTLGNTRS